MIINSLQCSGLSEIVAMPGLTHFFFAEAHLFNEKVGYSAPAARLLVSLILHSLRLHAR